MKPSQLLTFLAAAALGLSGAVVPVAAALAQTSRPQIRFVKPKLSRDRGAPGKRGEGASRTCESEERLASLTALVPDYVEEGQKAQVLGKTTKSHPELSFYVPVAADDVASVSLVLMLMDEAGNLLEEVPVDAPSSPGVVQVSLPESFAGLAAGDRLQWYLEMELLCAGDDLAEANYSSVTGWVEREAMPAGIDAALSLHGAVENAQILASLGFWFDALELVADQRQSDPADAAAAADWAALMESIGLDALTTAELQPEATTLSD